VVQYSSQALLLLKAELKYRWRAHRWSFWCMLLLPKLGCMLEVKNYGQSAMACGAWPIFRGDL